MWENTQYENTILMTLLAYLYPSHIFKITGFKMYEILAMTTKKVHVDAYQTLGSNNPNTSFY